MKSKIQQQATTDLTTPKILPPLKLNKMHPGKAQTNPKGKSQFSINFFQKKNQGGRKESLYPETPRSLIQEDKDDDFAKQIENDLEENFEEIEQDFVKKKLERQIDDFIQSDSNQSINFGHWIGNILHRACIDQQQNIILDICNEFQIVVQEMDNIQSVKQQLADYVNKPDKFKCNPLLLCCFKQGMIHEKSKRFNCILYLVSLGADVNTINHRTLWSPLHWCSYYGDYESVLFLLKQGITTHRPDFKGNYPIDLAGKQMHKAVVEILLQQGIKLLLNFEGLKEDQFQIFDEQIQQQVEKVLEQDDKWLRNPILRCKLLYWAVSIQADVKYIKMLIQLSRVYYMVPIIIEHQMTSLHAASQSGNFHAIKILIESHITWLDDQHVQKYGHSNNKQTAISNQVIEVSSFEFKHYSDEFYEQIIQFAQWEIKYLQNRPKKQVQIIPVNEIKTNSNISFLDQGNPITINSTSYIDQKDSFGNTALHLASLKGHFKIVDFLLNRGANMESENKELFKARQLTQHKEVQKVYQEKLKLINRKEILVQVNLNLWVTLKYLYKEKLKSDELKIINTMPERSINY